MIASAKTKNGKAIHRAIDMGGFLYIACGVDRSTMYTERVHGEITCKKCLGLKNVLVPDYLFASGIHALKHPFCRKVNEVDGFGAGYHDGNENIKKYLLNGLSDKFIEGYNEGYSEGQQLYTYHYKKGNKTNKPLTNEPLRTSFGNPNQSTSNTTKLGYSEAYYDKHGNTTNNTAPDKKKSTFILVKLINWIKNLLN